MHCHHCQNLLSENAKFCKQCGRPTQPASAQPVEPAPAHAACDACGASCSPSAKFCLQCGVSRSHSQPECVDAAQAAVELTAAVPATPSAEAAEAPAPVVAETLASPAPAPADADADAVKGTEVPSRALSAPVKAALAGVALVVLAGGAWMLFTPSAPTAINTERLHAPNGALTEDEDKAKAASLVGPQDVTPAPVPAVVAAPEVQPPAQTEVAPVVQEAPLSAPSASADPAPRAAAKPAAPRPAPQPAGNSLDSLLD